MAYPVLTATRVKQIASQCDIEIVQSMPLRARKPVYAPIPTRLHPDLIQKLSSTFPQGLYRHQAMALDGYLDDKDVVVSTSTASGKSLIFISAAIDALLKNPVAKTLALYPAKALIRDQLEKWEASTKGTSMGVGFIDGTVSMDRRKEILDSNRIILMTPDVVHAWLMANPQEKVIARLREALRLLVLDEAHVYEGVFGTNMAYLLRRLDAVTKGYRLMCSTATLGKPSDFVFQLTGRQTLAIGPESDGSAAPERQVLVAPDPGYDKIVELLKMLGALEGGRFLAFSDSRKMVEQVVAATMRIESPSASDADDEEDDSPPPAAVKNRADPDESRVLPFRAGYEAEDAKSIQSALYRGKLGGVVSTSAMELGLDIGEIDLVVMLGLPPSLKAFWQRLGRAGRKREGICLVIDTKGVLAGIENGLRDYLEKPLEPSWLYLNNKYLLYSNALCAAFECSEVGAGSDRPPFETLPASFKRLLENELNPTETIPADLYPLKQRAQAGPHREFPLRSGIERDFKITTPQGEGLGNVSFSQMLREAYPGAVYYYMARPYRIGRIDIRTGAVSAHRSKFWTTRPIANTMIFPRFNGGLISLAGTSEGFIAQSELQVSERVTGFQEVKGRNKGEPHKYGPGSEWYRREITRFFETTGVCWFFDQKAAMTEDAAMQILQSFCLDYGIQERDVGFGLFYSKQDPFGAVRKTQGICLYDAVSGSLRLTERLAENFFSVIESALRIAEADRRTLIASQLAVLLEECKGLEVVPVNQGRGVERLSTLENWSELIANGEKAMYVSDDGPAEVTVTGYRFTPKGLMYELAPENSEGAKWMVAERAIQPLNGVTRTVWVDLMTGEERETPPEA